MRTSLFTLIASNAVSIATVGCSGGTGQSTSGDVANAQSDLALTAANMHARGQIIPRLSATPTESDSTVPPNGDLNPYGVAFVPRGFPEGGLIHQGDIVVANFNNSANLQGTGTTVVKVNTNAAPSVFFSNASAPGFSTALGVLQRGFVLLGNLPSTDGSGMCTEGENGQEQNVGQGSLMVIDRHGRLVETLTDAKLLDGPWDLTIRDLGSRALVFVSNALTGTVTRVNLRVDGDDRRAQVVVESKTQIASGYVHRCDPAAFVVAPTGVALDPRRDILYVASAGDNKIFAIDDASDRLTDRGMGRLVVQDQTHLHGPLGLARASGGDLISAQGDAVNPDPNQPSEIVEFNQAGRFVAQFSIDPAPGSAFGLALEEHDNGAFRFAAVDDGLNVLDIWDVK